MLGNVVRSTCGTENNPQRPIGNGRRIAFTGGAEKPEGAFAGVRDRALHVPGPQGSDEPTLKRISTSVDDVSPWPQADRVNPTQGELAEDQRWLMTQSSSLETVCRKSIAFNDLRLAVRVFFEGDQRRRWRLDPDRVNSVRLRPGPARSTPDFSFLGVAEIATAVKRWGFRS